MMKWVLVITTFMHPHVELRDVEVPVRSEQECHELIRKFDDRWNGKNPHFYYRFECKTKDVDE